jgi:hypothetical protein
MRTTGLRVEGLPQNPLDAAGLFYSKHLPEIRENSAGSDMIVIYFEPAGHEHQAWRLAAIRELAREVAPARANAIVGKDYTALAEALDYLARAPGITGQLLAVDPG